MSFLFTPGPTNIDDNISLVSGKIIGHRTKDFEILYKNCYDITKCYFNDKNNTYTPIFITGSGTIAVEMIVKNFLISGKVLLITNGFFGEKWINLLKSYSITYTHKKYDWLESFNFNEIETILHQNNYEKIFCVHHETSTGIVNNIYNLNILCEKYNCDLYLDCVSSAFYEDINLFKLSRLSAFSFSTNKCLMSYPGLAIIMAKESEYAKLNDNNLSYLNIKHYYDFSEKKQTPFTPAVSLFFCYYEAVKNIISHKKNYLEIKKHIINELISYNIKCLNDNLDSCDWLLVLEVDNPKLIIETLEKKQFIIYGGKGELSNNTIQISLLNQNKETVQYLLNELKLILKK